MGSRFGDLLLRSRFGTVLFHTVSSPLQKGIRFFRILNISRPWACLTVGLPCVANTWRTTDVSTFPMIALNEQRRWDLYAGGLCSRAGTLETNNHTTHDPPKGIVYDLLVLVGLFRYDDAYGLCLVSPYCSALALHRGELSEGFICYHMNPFRYIVDWASHPVISATAACQPRGLKGTLQV